MKIALLGYGKMGKVIEQILLERGHSIVFKASSDFNEKELLDADVAIEFSVPNAVVDNINKCFSVNLPIVVGTTGWYNHFDEIKKFCLKNNQALFYATNFSIGVNLFFKLNEQLAQWMSKHEDYQVSMNEIHHIHKLDAPSGTAITLAEGIIQQHKKITNWSLDAKNESELPVTSIREGEVTGTHIIKYQSEVDTIQISHEAHSRKGFALGAVIAAEWLQNKKGIFTMQDMLNL
jgi:4-hydroxy-tetrahydrodipicolinate reductase